VFIFLTAVNQRVFPPLLSARLINSNIAQKDVKHRNVRSMAIGMHATNCWDVIEAAGVVATIVIMILIGRDGIQGSLTIVLYQHSARTCYPIYIRIKTTCNKIGSINHARNSEWRRTRWVTKVQFLAETTIFLFAITSVSILYICTFGIKMFFLREVKTVGARSWPLTRI